MTKQRLALEPGEQPRIELDWGTYMREFEVRFDGKEIGRIDGGQKVLRDPHSFTLPDGSELTIQLKKSQMIDELEVLRNGKPLPGSASNPLTKLSAVIRSSFFWGIITLVAGLVVQFSGNEWVTRLTFSPYSILFGLILLGCSIFLLRRSLTVGVIALVAFSADWALAAYYAQQVGISYNFVSTMAILARILSLLPFIQGVAILRDIRLKSN